MNSGLECSVGLHIGYAASLPVWVPTLPADEYYWDGEGGGEGGLGEELKLLNT